MTPEDQSLSRQALTALQEAVDEVVEEARRTHGTIVVWEDDAVRCIPADELPPTKRHADGEDETERTQPSP